MRRSKRFFGDVFSAGDRSVRNFLFDNMKISRLIIWGLLFISVVALIQLTPILNGPQILPSDDYFHFWAAGNQNLHGINPFDPQIIAQRLTSEGSPPSNAMTSVMLNPPWTITLLMPFGLLSYPISRIAWLIFSIVLMLLSALFLWRIYAGNPKQRWLAILMIFIFAPTISLLEKGQVTAIVLLGITGFLYNSSYRHNDWLAGFFLMLASIKPQGALIFWLAVLFWVIYQRRWKIIISFAFFVLVMTLAAMVFNHNVIPQYIRMIQTYHITEWATPTFGAYLRLFWLGTENFWLQFLPSLFGLVWFIIYWNRNKESWDWLSALPLLVFVSQLTSPYSWTYDLVIVIPAIILATIWIVTNWKNWSVLLLLVLFLSINIIDLLLHMRLDEFWFIWLAPVFFIWYLLVQWNYQKNKNRQFVPEANS
jgi:hypothetical protein